MKLVTSYILVTLPLTILIESPKAQIVSHWAEDSSYYLYQAVDEDLVSYKISFNQNLSKKEILDSIATHLTNVFFITSNDYYKDKRKIVVTVPKVNSIEVHNRRFHIALINIIDPDNVCMTSFFQGSTGGYNTYLTIVSNFMQPQLSVPLLDGIIFTYNDEELKAMDHINLEGLISEREIDNLVRKAIKN